MMQQQQERRRLRSDHPSEAIQLQLQQVADRHGLDVLVLADQAGNLWSAANIDCHAEELAASLPQLPLAPDGRGVSQTKHRRRAVRVAQVQVASTKLWLATRGARSARRAEQGLLQARGAVARILADLAR